MGSNNIQIALTVAISLLTLVIGWVGALIVSKLNDLKKSIEKIFDIIRENEKSVKEDLKEYRTTQSCIDFHIQHTNQHTSEKEQNEKEHAALKKDIDNIADLVRSNQK